MAAATVPQLTQPDQGLTPETMPETSEAREPQPCPEHGPTEADLGCLACQLYGRHLRLQQAEAIDMPAGGASGSDDADLQSSGQQASEAPSVTSEPGPQDVPPPWPTPSFIVAVRAALRAETLSRGRKAKMALSSQGIRTSWRLILPCAIDAYPRNGRCERSSLFAHD